MLHTSPSALWIGKYFYGLTVMGKMAFRSLQFLDGGHKVPGNDQSERWGRFVTYYS